MATIRGLSLSHLARLAAGRHRVPRPVHVLICIADHFEPRRDNRTPNLARQRAARWRGEFPLLATRFQDSRGESPQHTFFFPAEEYDPEHVDELARICRLGFGDVEVHLHHDNDTSDHLRETLETFTRALHERHGLLQRDAAGRLSYGFIHGNWALDNSRPDGRWCGVNDELTVLRQTGCYADFTMPSAPAPCQTRTVNSIYYASDDPQRPMSHDAGRSARVGALPPAESLLMIQGPLQLDWRQRKYGLLPRLENGDLTARRPPTLPRLWNWLAAGVQVQGQPHWRFIKLHTHGAVDANASMLLGEPMRQFHADLAQLAADCDWFKYYYVTARQMAQLVHAAERGDAQTPAAVLGTVSLTQPAATRAATSAAESGRV
jgi:hypothetical protein